ncbi:hypothetical protein CsSME_00024246 [Camellia sinensis var. sinensis]
MIKEKERERQRDKERDREGSKLSMKKGKLAKSKLAKSESKCKSAKCKSTKVSLMEFDNQGDAQISTDEMPDVLPRRSTRIRVAPKSLISGDFVGPWQRLSNENKRGLRDVESEDSSIECDCVGLCLCGNLGTPRLQMNVEMQASTEQSSKQHQIPNAWNTPTRVLTDLEQWPKLAIVSPLAANEMIMSKKLGSPNADQRREVIDTKQRKSVENVRACSNEDLAELHMEDTQYGKDKCLDGDTTAILGKNFCMVQIGELFANPVCVNSTEQIQNIFMFLHRSEGLSKHVDSFMQMLSLVQLKKGDHFILAPLFSDELHEATFLRSLDLFEGDENDFDAVLAEMEKEMSMSDIMKELGYGCTVNVSRCVEMLSLFLPLTEITVSRILCTIARSHAGLEDNQNAFSTFCYALGTDSSSDLPLMSSWNIDVLIDSIKQLAPETNWISVVENLDHEGFYFPNEAAFSFFMSVYKRACQDPFPLHAICGSVWKNTEGQLSFLKNAVAVPPEVFTFANAGRQLVYVDAVHGLKFQPGHANHAWLCLDLLEVLCLLAERGHASAVQSMLKHPLEHCPEVLLLGMAHINTAYNFLQYEVSSIVFAKILKNSTGSGMVLHLWHVNPNLLVQSFLDARNIDPDDISRVLDICQEL